MLLMLLRLLETRLLLDVSSVSRKTWLPSPARGQSIFHLTSSFTSSSLAAVPLFWLDSTLLCSTLYSVLFCSARQSAPLSSDRPKRREENLPLTTITNHLTYSPNSNSTCFSFPPNHNHHNHLEPRPPPYLVPSLHCFLSVLSVLSITLPCPSSLLLLTHQ